MSDDKAKVFLPNSEQRPSASKWIAALLFLGLITGAGWAVYSRQDTSNPAEGNRQTDDVRAETEKQLRAGNIEYIEAYLNDAASKRRRKDTPCTYRCAMIGKELVVFAQCDGILERMPATQAIAQAANELGEVLAVGTPIARAEMEFKNVKGVARVVIPMDQARNLGKERTQQSQPRSETLAAYAKAINWESFNTLFGPPPEIVHDPKFDKDNGNRRDETGIIAKPNQ